MSVLWWPTCPFPFAGEDEKASRCPCDGSGEGIKVERPSRIASRMSVMIVREVVKGRESDTRASRVMSTRSKEPAKRSLLTCCRSPTSGGVLSADREPFSRRSSSCLPKSFSAQGVPLLSERPAVVGSYVEERKRQERSFERRQRDSAEQQ